MFIIIIRDIQPNLLFSHQNSPQHLLDYKWTTKRTSYYLFSIIRMGPENILYGYKLFYSTILTLKNGLPLPKGPPALYCANSKRSYNQICKLDTKLYHSAFLIQTGPTKGPPALYCNKTKGTSNQRCYLKTYIPLVLYFHNSKETSIIQNGPPKGLPVLYLHNTIISQSLVNS